MAYVAADYHAKVQAYFVTTLGRPATAPELAQFSQGLVDNAGSVWTSGLANYLTTQTGFPAGTNYGQIVTDMYTNLTGAAPNMAAYNFYVGQLLTGSIKLKGLANAIINDSGYMPKADGTYGAPAGWVTTPATVGATDAALDVFKLKIGAAGTFTDALDTPAENTDIASASGYNAAKTWLAAVINQASAEAATTASADAAIATVSGAGSVGETFMLTTGLDNVAGTSGNDTINGSVSATAADNTLGLADVINGGAGTDTLNVTAAVLAADIAVPAGNIQNVETVNIRALDNDGTVGTDAATFAAGNASGVTAVNADRSTSNVTVTGLANGASVGMIGDGVVANGILKYAYATATADQVINISGGTNNAGVADITATASTGVTKATINSTGAANKVDTIKLDSVGGGTVTTLNVNAATNLTATLTGADFAATSALTVAGAAASVDLGTAANFKTIDASGLTAGGLTIALGTNTTSFKGGQGNDVVTTAAVAATTAGAVDAGAGTADVLNVAAGADVDTAAEAAVYTNFEVLRNSGATDLDVSLLSGITSIQLNSANAGATKMTAAQAAAITNRTDNGTNTFSLATATGTADVMSVTLQNTTATASADLTAATITGFETLNVVSSSGSSADINALSFAAAGDLTALNISGAKPISVTTTNITKAAAINASGLTYAGSTATDYALTITGNLVKGSSVTGSAAADSLTTTAAITGTSGDFVTYDAGAGNDVISSTAAAINNTSGANGSVKIEGGAGTDKLTLTDAGGLTLVDANVQYVTGVEEISYTVANKAISITSGGFFDTNFKTNGAKLTLGDATNAQVNTVDLTSFSGAATVALTATAATTQAQTITTGSGADTVTLLAAGTTTGAHTISTGAGNDTINVTIAGATITTGTVTINGGAGKDTITITGDSTANADTAVNTIVKVQEGHSTLTDFDVITGAVVSTATKEAFQLDFDGTASANANVTASSVTGYTSAELTYTVTNGLLAFAGTSAAALTAAQKATIAQTVITTADKAVAFVDGTDSYVFHNGATTDSLVKLVGVTLSGIDAVAAGYIDIA